MTKFKPGDKIMRTRGSTDSFMKRGQIYTFVQYNGINVMGTKGINVEGSDLSYDDDNFILISSPSRKPKTAEEEIKWLSGNR